MTKNLKAFFTTTFFPQKASLEMLFERPIMPLFVYPLIIMSQAYLALFLSNLLDPDMGSLAVYILLFLCAPFIMLGLYKFYAKLLDSLIIRKSNLQTETDKHRHIALEVTGLSQPVCSQIIRSLLVFEASVLLVFNILSLVLLDTPSFLFPWTKSLLFRLMESIWLYYALYPFYVKNQKRAIALIVKYFILTGFVVFLSTHVFFVAVTSIFRLLEG